jgi:hypothetical protein
MNDVFMERLWPQPQTDADMQGMVESVGCMAIHRIEWCGSLLSADGREMFCHFRAPDAESLRIALTPEDLARANVAVGHEFDEPADAHARELSESVDMGCFQIHRVRRVRSYLSSDRRRMFSLYEAPDAESVRLVQREAGLPPDRVWAVRRFAP